MDQVTTTGAWSPRTPRISVFPAHPSQIPPAIRETLDTVLSRLALEDAAMETAILTALRAQRLTAMIPALAAAVEAEHPTLTRRSVLRILEIRTGLSYGHVVRLAYRRGVTCSR